MKGMFHEDWAQAGSVFLRSFEAWLLRRESLSVLVYEVLRVLAGAPVCVCATRKRMHKLCNKYWWTSVYNLFSIFILAD